MRLSPGKDIELGKPGQHGRERKRSDASPVQENLDLVSIQVELHRNIIPLVGIKGSAGIHRERLSEVCNVQRPSAKAKC